MHFPVEASNQVTHRKRRSIGKASFRLVPHGGAHVGSDKGRNLGTQSFVTNTSERMVRGRAEAQMCVYEAIKLLLILVDDERKALRQELSTTNSCRTSRKARSPHCIGTACGHASRKIATQSEGAISGLGSGPGAPGHYDPLLLRHELRSECTDLCLEDFKILASRCNPQRGADTAPLKVAAPDGSSKCLVNWRDLETHADLTITGLVDGVDRKPESNEVPVQDERTISQRIAESLRAQQQRLENAGLSCRVGTYKNRESSEIQPGRIPDGSEASQCPGRQGMPGHCGII
jgi:hypothetical protein